MTISYSKEYYEKQYLKDFLSKILINREILFNNPLLKITDTFFDTKKTNFALKISIKGIIKLRFPVLCIKLCEIQVFCQKKNIIFLRITKTRLKQEKYCKEYSFIEIKSFI